MSQDLEAGGEAKAWEEVLARWEDEEAHRAYLARFSDLDGLARRALLAALLLGAALAVSWILYAWLRLGAGP